MRRRGFIQALLGSVLGFVGVKSSSRWTALAQSVVVDPVIRPGFYTRSVSYVDFGFSAWSLFDENDDFPIKVDEQNGVLHFEKTSDYQLQILGSDGVKYSFSRYLVAGDSWKFSLENGVAIDWFAVEEIKALGSDRILMTYTSHEAENRRWTSYSTKEWGPGRAWSEADVKGSEWSYRRGGQREYVR